LDSSDSSLSQRTGPLDLNEALFCRGVGPRGLCHKEMMRAGAYPVQVKLPCPLGLLSQWEEMVAVKLPSPLEATEVAIAELLVAEEIAVAELLSQYEQMVVAELLVDQEEWQVHGLHVMVLEFDLTIYITFVGISAHLRKFHAGSTI
jgi:hypothetical protein